MTLKQNWTEVKKCLKYCSNKDLLGVIQDLYKLNKENKGYLHLRFLAGNNPAQKVKLLKETIDLIKDKWGNAFHDPYGNSGKEVHLKITPIKTPVTIYKKAIGVDNGYILILVEYIIHGINCLSRCAESSDNAVNSINSIAQELFNLIANNDEYMDILSNNQKEVIGEFMEGNHSPPPCNFDKIGQICLF